MVTLSGFDKLSHDLEEAQKAMEQLDSELGVVEFDPNDPGSIEAAIVRVEELVDQRLGAYVSNPIVGPISAGLKEKFRESIIERASAARLQTDGA